MEHALAGCVRLVGVGGYSASCGVGQYLLRGLADMIRYDWIIFFMRFRRRDWLNLTSKPCSSLLIASAIQSTCFSASFGQSRMASKRMT